ncbi:putative bifunctional diguanylate cyclase/phosphodiesterase [Psychrobacillus sp. NPDC058041]|uniref:putative bifunctional diguanylate cyclase/phosphodiesterase n=1 Tax=Psychrobacillus sp. NPDC058041 TaxID=3346310 RepID=UPI0036DEF832
MINTLLNSIDDSGNKNDKNILHQLLDMSHSYNLSQKDALVEICRKSLSLLDVDQVFIWSLSSDNSTLSNIASSIQSEDGVLEVHQKDHPHYFDLMKEKQFWTEKQMEESILQMSPFPYRLEFRFGNGNDSKGILSIRSSTKREWSKNELLVLPSIVHSIMLLIERESYKKLATIDTLTGLSKLTSFLEETTERMTKVDETMDTYFIYLKIDLFQDIQDVLGIDGADEVLKEVGLRIQMLFPEPYLTARIGFDHFAIYFDTANKPQMGERYYERVDDALAKKIMVSGQEVYLTYSIGFSQFPQHGENAKACLNAAQIALNNGRKKFSRNAQTFYTPEMYTSKSKDLLTEMNLRKGIEANEFELYYQPKVNCNDGSVTGFEALIRWNHPELGIRGPMEFIPIAESTGLIIPLGEWVITEAVKQLSLWNEGHRINYTISINISSRHFLHSDFPKYLLKQLNYYKVSPARLVIEVTESVAMIEYDTVKERIDYLNDLGFSVSIDDFGTGFSAFVYLQHFPVKEIKIDRQFIQRIDCDEKSLGITKTIIDLAKQLSLKVVSEGVETKEQWEKLKSLGCDEIQGFYFSKPLNIERIEELY